MGLEEKLKQRRNKKIFQRNKLLWMKI